MWTSAISYMSPSLAKPLKHAIPSTISQPLTTVSQATYLGIELASNLSWTPHINKITSKASQSLGFLKRTFNSAKSETKTAAYKSIVRPTLEYSSPVWDQYKTCDIQKLEKKFN